MQSTQLPQNGQWANSPSKPRRRVVVSKRVSVEEFKQHREKMESLGLDPADPAPADTSGDTQSGELPAVRRERLEVERRDRERWERVEHENRPRSFRTREEQIQSQRHERALARCARGALVRLACSTESLWVSPYVLSGGPI